MVLLSHFPPLNDDFTTITVTSQSMRAKKQSPEYIQRLLSFFTHFQEQIILELTKDDSVVDTMRQQSLEILLVAYTRVLFKYCGDILCGSNATKAQSYNTEIQELLSSSLHGIVLNPYLHSLCACTGHHSLMHKILPLLVKFLTDLVNCSANEHKAQLDMYISTKFTSSILSQPLNNSSGGWATLKAAFEASDASYSITEEGMLYSAVQSNNTCAVVPIGFSAPTKAAWEFMLVSDSANDECSGSEYRLTIVYRKDFSSSLSLVALQIGAKANKNIARPEI